MKILNINSTFYSSTIHAGLQNAQISANIDAFTYSPRRSDLSLARGPNVVDDKNAIVSLCFNQYDRFIFRRKHKLIFNDIQDKINVSDFDCIHAHYLFDNGYTALKLKEKYNIPYVVTIRNYDVNFMLKKMIHLRRIGRRILENADAVAFFSVAYRNFILNKYIPNKQRDSFAKKSIVLTGGIDSFWHNNTNEGKELKNPKSIKVLHVGTIDYNKNLITTAKAIRLLQRSGYDVSYTAVGRIINQNLIPKISKLIDFKHIDQIPKDKLLEIYRDHDILVVPSIRESFGLVYPEAMSQGLPVIYSKGQGFDGMFADGVVGYAVQSLDFKEIAKRIIDISNNYNEISRNCITNTKIYDWKRIGEEYYSLYNSLI